MRPSISSGELGREYSYLLGLYLGDGCLSAHARGVYRLRITLDTRYPGIIDECAAAMGKVMPGRIVSRQPRVDRCVDVNCYSKAWPILLPQHGVGKNHLREIRLEAWQQALVDRWPEALLRGLIHSDGCRFTNTGRGGWVCPRYCFSNLSTDIKGIFCRTCDQLGLRCTVAGRKTVYVSRKADVARMDEFIGPKT